MAMPTDFWRNDQMLNIFRTKPCQRLARDGVCGWRSQCQYAHYLEWPRRQPRRYHYSPEMCPNIRVIEEDGGGVRLENNCSAGLRCPWSHSKEEVIFHPLIFKTTLCEEHTNNSGTTPKTRNAKKNRCHRYYCPFAHGAEEIRKSDLSEEQREKCLRAMEVFPSDVCCVVCTRHWLTPVADTASQMGMDRGVGAGMPAINPGFQFQDMLAGPLSTVPNMPSLLQGEAMKPPKDIFSKYLGENHGFMHHGPIREDPFFSAYKPEFNASQFYGEPLSSLRVSTAADDAPAFIDLAGYPGERQPTSLPTANYATPFDHGFKLSQPKQEPEVDLAKLYYAML